VLTELQLPEIDIFDADFAKDPTRLPPCARDGCLARQVSIGYIPLDYEAVRHS